MPTVRLPLPLVTTAVTSNVPTSERASASSTFCGGVDTGDEGSTPPGPPAGPADAAGEGVPPPCVIATAAETTSTTAALAPAAAGHQRRGRIRSFGGRVGCCGAWWFWSCLCCRTSPGGPSPN